VVKGKGDNELIRLFDLNFVHKQPELTATCRVEVNNEIGVAATTPNVFPRTFELEFSSSANTKKQDQRHASCQENRMGEACWNRLILLSLINGRVI